jgi:predicted TIM-barrel fold metal-dependent hydrolase
MNADTTLPSSGGRSDRISRRRVLSATVKTVGVMTAASAISGTVIQGASLMTATEPVSPTTPWIDAHSHIWTNDLSVYKLRPGATPAQLVPPSFTDDELMAIAIPQGVGRVVLIQHWPHHGWDNSYLIDAWKRHPQRFRIVGQIDDTITGQDKLMKSMLLQGVTGFRIGPGVGPKDWLGTDGMKLMWKTAAETRQSMCCLINPEDLAGVSAMCAQFPGTPVVIDHFARIGASGDIPENQVSQLCGLAKHPLVRVKLSAYYAFGKKQAPHHEMIPMIRQLFETYGADRLMWASDCPYQLNEHNTYRSSISLIRDQIDFVTKEERMKLLQGTAESTFFFV